MCGLCSTVRQLGKCPECGMRPDIEERRLLVRDVAAQLTEIAAQKPDAVFAVKERRYHALVDRVEYDADNNTAIVEVVWNL